MRTRRLWGVLAAALAACAVLLSACGARTPSAQQSAVVSLPEPREEADEMFMGERLGQRRYEVTLYYAAQDSGELSPVNRTLYVEENASLAREALEALLTAPGGYDLQAVAPGETELLSLEETGGLVTVNLSIDARSVQSDQELYLMHAAIASTLLDLDGVNGVNVLIGGQAESVFRLPLGLMTTPLAGTVGTLAQMQAESERFLSGDYAQRGTLRRQAALYFPAAGGGRVFPEARELSFSDDNYAVALAEALREGPSAQGACLCPLPKEGDLFTEIPNSFISEQGERVLTLFFTQEVGDYLAETGIGLSQFAASITLTACSFIPEMDAVRISLGGEILQEVEIGETLATLSDGLSARRLYEDAIGASMTLYFAGEGDALRAAERVVTQETARSPRLMLEQLFSGPRSGEEQVSALPEGASPLDVLGVSVEGGVARVNLSGDFYRRCQALDEAGERRAAYAIVNTLTELEWINGVRIWFEGSPAEWLVEDIYLKGMLMYNPGIVETQAEE